MATLAPMPCSAGLSCSQGSGLLFDALAGARQEGGDAVAVVRGVLSLPDQQLDYAQAKLAFDRVIDPSTDAPTVLAELDGMAERALSLAGPSAGDDAKLAGLRTLIYENGPWNDHRPFAYDHQNYRSLEIKLLRNYLATRLGNCVSMPILFLILAGRLGLDMALALAPQHYFLRQHANDGRIVNLEPTSGALPARDCWVRQSRGVSKRWIESGFYMRSLGAREGVAAMAHTVVEHLMAERRFDEALAVTGLILACNPRDGAEWAHRGNAFERIIRAQYLDRYRSQLAIPLPLRPGYQALLARNLSAFATARELGWEPRE